MSDGLTEKDKAKLKEIFFLPPEGSGNKCVCRHCPLKGGQPTLISLGNEYTNMLTHLTNHHPNFRESLVMSDYESSNCFRLICDDDSQNAYSWIDWNINSDSDKPFSFCEDKKTRSGERFWIKML